MDPEVARQLATIRGEFAELRAALGTNDPAAAFGDIRQLVQVVHNLSVRVSALEAIVIPPSP